MRLPSLLPQPPSFSKKRNYEIHAVLGTGSFGKVLHATWTPDPTHGTGSDRTNSHYSTASSVPESVHQGDGVQAPPNSGNDKKGIDVALKIIPKKKVKGNESVVWGEMEVLRGLNHPNIVSRSFINVGVLISSDLEIRSNFMNGLNRGINTTYHLNLLLVVNCLKE
jgi:serine/threonine protein kinase